MQAITRGVQGGTLSMHISEVIGHQRTPPMDASELPYRGLKIEPNVLWIA